MILNKVINGKEYICQILPFENGLKMNVFDDGCILVAESIVKITSSKEALEKRFEELVLNYITPLPL